MSFAYLQNIKPTGIILAGGQSSRMGKDKALLKIGTLSFLETIYNTISPLCSEIIISTNNPEVYLNNTEGISDRYKNIGPMGGIYTCLVQSKTEENFIVSVDTPLISSELLQYIYDNSTKNTVTICRHKGKIHPLIGVYKKSFIKFLKEDIKNKKYKTIASIEKSNHLYLEITDDLHFYKSELFININNPSDFSKIKGLK